MLLINAVNAEGRPVELYVKDGKIAAVGQDLAALAGENETVLDAGGLTVLPAFVDLHCHWRTPGFDTLDHALTAPVYLSSANAITADGQILNIDGRGNRLAALVYGIGKTVYIVAGTNKICPDFDSALSRARNAAAVQNMQRFDGDQPCHTAGRCLDCRSKSRGCNALLVLWGQMMDMAKVEVVLIDEPLGL